MPQANGPIADAGTRPAFASLSARCGASLIDLTVLALPATLAQRISGSTALIPGAWLLVLSAAYFTLAYASTGGGYSLGKRLLSIRVVNRSGTPLSWTASAIRWAVAIGVGLPLGIVAASFERGTPFGVWPAMTVAVPVACVVVADSYLLLFNRPTRQSLHDLAAGSLVVRRSHTGAVPVAPVWPGHLGWIAACCIAVAAVLPAPYRWARELVPRSVELLRAREHILASHQVSGFIVSPGFAIVGRDTIWYVSVLGRINAAPQTEHDAESLRLSLACALVREAPRTLRSAELYLMVSFDPGAVKTPGTTTYVVDTDLTRPVCDGLPRTF